MITMNRNATRDMYFIDDLSKNVRENIFVLFDKLQQDLNYREIFYVFLSIKIKKKNDHHLRKKEMIEFFEHALQLYLRVKSFYYI